jgi:hypothetical protein
MEGRLVLMTDAGKLDTSFVLGEGTSETVSACLAVLREHGATAKKTGGEGK